MPEALVHARALDFLDDDERLVLNQIRAHAYLGIWSLGERFVLPFVMLEASRSLHRDEEEFLALMGVGQQAAKHIVAFTRFAQACEHGFDAELGIIGPAGDAVAPFLTRDTLAVGVLVLHLLCTAQPHSLRAMRGAGLMNEPFRRLLQLHWREECQSVRVLSLVVGKLAREASRHQRERAFEQYLTMLDEISASFRPQVRLDLAAFEQSARPLSEQQREAFLEIQGRSYDELFLRSGLEHPTVRRAIADLLGEASPALELAAERFSAVAGSGPGPA
ncbi:MAG: hypothetical protein OEZ06_19295 [Myxococcales bacterium]|nr:hypothetical protein [Myxococcales bacterium]